MKSILFNTKMVRAILDGRKTVTRRLVKPPALYAILEDENGECVGSYYEDEKTSYIYPTVDDCPYQPGDILYVRETWNCLPIPEPLRGTSRTYWYKADESNPEDKWRPSIHMPREAARIFLRVTGVRVERLQDITDKQAEAEGIERRNVPVINAKDVFEYKIPGTSNVCTSAHGAFRHLWDSTIKPADRTLYGWDANPWVWVIEFEWCENPEREDDNG